ncbi:MAG: P-type conjugative transfer protein TrbJ [Rhizobiales bacterium]|nr:P-type conjugative transfer protein TrbJ [Hyphomicrobiales bacterium]
MTTRSSKIHLALAASVMVATGLVATTIATRPAQALTVFDPWNYKQNLLTAIRSLTEIENQVKQLTNEAQMLMKMDLNLEQLGSSVAGDLKDSMGEIKSLLDEANGIAMDVKATESKIKDLFPDEYASAFTNDQSLKQAKSRWDETLSAFKRSMSLEAKVVENTTEDGNTLSDLLSKSGSAVGSLQVQQAGNELLGLGIKQQLQLQNLMAADQRAQALDRARALSSQEESRLRFQSFVGDGVAYTP